MSWSKIQTDLLTFTGKTVVDMLLPPSHTGKKQLVQRIRERLDPEITAEAKARILERVLLEAAPDKKVRELVRGAMPEFLFLVLERALTDQRFFAARDPNWTMLLTRERSGESQAFIAIQPGVESTEEFDLLFGEWQSWINSRPEKAEGLILFVFESAPKVPMDFIRKHNIGVSHVAKAGGFDASVPTFAVPDGKLELYLNTMRSKPFWIQSLLPMLDYVKECYQPVVKVFSA